MLKRYTFWLWVAIVFQLLTALAHSLSFVVTSVPNNETERQLLDILANYRMDMGAGIRRTPGELFKALSSCFSLLYLLCGLINIYLLRKHVDVGVVRGLVGIQLLVLGLCFGIMALWTFLPPIILTGLVFITLAITYLTATQRA